MRFLKYTALLFGLLAATQAFAEDWGTQQPFLDITGINTITGVTLTSPVVNNATGIGQAALATSTTQTALTSTTTLTGVTGLSVPVVASGTYDCTANIFLTSAAAGGVQLALAGANSMTATSAEYQVSLGSTTTPGLALVQTTTFGTGLGSTTTVNSGVITGSVVVNAGGNIVVQAAQNASSGSATTILSNSNLGCWRSN